MTPETSSVVDRVLSPGRFFVAPPGRLRVEHVADERIGWEIFRGHLVEPTRASEPARFEAWHVYVDESRSPSPVPLVSLRWLLARPTWHVTRNILTHGFEAYEESPTVIMTRPAQKWVAELVGSVDATARSDEKLAEELSTLVFLAIVGSSRLPITSLESPLPAFSLGKLAYFPGFTCGAESSADPFTLLASTLDSAGSSLEQAKALEITLRATGDVPRLAQSLAQRGGMLHDWLSALFRELFNNVSLSPYTEFVDRLVELLRQLAAIESIGPTRVIDLAGYMLRHLVRHLTAFDLTLFHNFGANYPDAVFLDALLKIYLRLIDSHPAAILPKPDDSDSAVQAKRRRRRALRQACLVRRQYEGHRVPDAPTSIGENLRVLPAPFVRVSDEQIVHAGRRRRVLFENDPLTDLLTGTARQALDASLADLEYPLELIELGMAHFLDRPLGICKEPGELDRTPLISYEAVSHRIAKKRIDQLIAAGWLASQAGQQAIAALDRLDLVGLPPGSLSPLERPGVVSLADVAKASDDFVLIRSTRQSLVAVFARYDLQPLRDVAPATADWLATGSDVLLVQRLPQGAPLAEAALEGYDRRGRLHIVFGLGPKRGAAARYVERAGSELPRALRVLRICEPNGALGQPTVLLK